MICEDTDHGGNYGKECRSYWYIDQEIGHIPAAVSFPQNTI